MRTIKRHNHPDAIPITPLKNEMDSWDIDHDIIPKDINAPGPGSMMEYGWWEEEIEKDILRAMTEQGLNRLEAIVYAFNRY